MKIFSTLILVLSVCLAKAQVITKLSPNLVVPGDTLVIHGKGFHGSSADYRVIFGTIQSAVIASDSFSLTTIVPYGLHSNNISVLDLSTHKLVTTSLRVHASTTAPFDSAYTRSSFSEKVQFTDARYSVDARFADLNNDGILDIVALKDFTHRIIFKINKGALQFENFTDSSFGRNISQLYLADLNNDGLTEVIIMTGDTSWYVLRNTSANGVFSMAAAERFPTRNDPEYLLFEDVNGDGLVDVIVNNWYEKYSIFFNHTTVDSVLTFTQKDTSYGNSAKKINLKDINLDGKPELIVTDEIKDSVWLYHNLTEGDSLNFVYAHAYKAKADVRKSDWFDIDGDGKNELLIGQVQVSDTLSVFRLLNSDSLEFDSVPRIFTTNAYSDSRRFLHDYDGNRTIDLISASPGANLFLFQNFSDTLQLLLKENSLATFDGNEYTEDVGDIDNDGQMDLLSKGRETFDIYLGRRMHADITEKQVVMYADSIDTASVAYLHLINRGEVTLSLESIAHHTQYTYKTADDSTLNFPIAIAAGDTFMLQVIYNGTAGISVTDTPVFLFNRNHRYRNSVMNGIFSKPFLRIDSVNNNKARPGDTLTIFGKHFGNDAENLEVRIGQLPCDVIGVFHDSMHIVTPKYFEYRELFVTQYDAERTFTAPFNIHPVYTGAENALFDLKSYALSVNNTAGGKRGGVAVMHLNKDSLPDILHLWNKATTSAVWTDAGQWLNEGKPRTPFMRTLDSVYAITNGTKNLFPVDINFNGMRDAIGISYNSFIDIYENTAAPGDSILFIPVSKYTHKLSRTYGEFAVNDFDRDGHSEILFSCHDSTMMLLTRNIQEDVWHYNVEQEVAVKKQFPYYDKLISADLDNDGLPEALAYLYNDSFIHVYRNISQPGIIRFENAKRVKTKGIVNGISVLNTNDLGFPEIVYYISDSMKVGILSNDGSGSLTYTEENIYPALKGKDPVITDVNGDGNSDLFLSYDSKAVLCQKLSDSSYDYHVVKYPFAPVAFTYDLDGDAQPDLFCSNRNIYLNNSAEANFNTYRKVLLETDTFDTHKTDTCLVKNTWNVPVFISAIETSPYFSVTDSAGDPLTYPIELDTADAYKIYVRFSPQFPVKKYFGKIKVHFDGPVHPLEKKLEGRVMLAPLVDSIFPSVAVPGDTLMIYGKNFDTALITGNIVRFGSMKASILEIENNSIRVIIPKDATEDFIQVVDTVINLSGFSPNVFTPKCNCRDNAFSIHSFGAEDTMYTESSYFIPTISADYDGNGETDLLGWVPRTKVGGGYFYVMGGMENRSSYRNIQLTSNAISSASMLFGEEGGGVPAIYDINADGISDLSWVYYAKTGVHPRPKENIFFYQLDTPFYNYQTGHVLNGTYEYFLNPHNWTTTYLGHDFNRDGIIDFNLGNAGDSATFYSYSKDYYEEDRTFLYEGSPLRWHSSYTKNVNDNNRIADFDGDGKPDLAVSGVNTGKIHLVRNKTTGDDILTDTGYTFTEANMHYQIAVADINLDGKPDVLATIYRDTSLIVLVNNSTPGTFSFTKVKVGTGTTYLGREFTLADFTGDGKPDLVAIKENNINDRQDTLLLLKNTSHGSTISFDRAVKIKTKGTRAPASIMHADLDHDHRPDIILGYSDGFIGVLRNTCLDGYLSRDSFNFTGGRTGVMQSAFAALHNSGNDSFEVQSVTLPGSGFKVYNLSTGTSDSTLKAPFKIAPGDSVRLRIVFLPDVAITYDDSVVLLSDAFSLPFTIRFRGENTPDAKAEISPDTLFFGNVLFYDSASRFTKIKNTGYDTLFISSLSVSDAVNFSVKTNAPFFILPGDSAMVEWQFKTLLSDSFNQYGSIHHDGGGHSGKIVFLAQGIGPETADSLALDFGSQAIRQAYDDSVLFTNTGTDTLFISQFIVGQQQGIHWIDSNAVKPTFILPGESYALRFRFYPDSTLSFKLSMTIEHNGINQQTVITITGQGTGAYMSSIGHVNFGTQRIYTSRIKTFNIYALGNDDLTIGNNLWHLGNNFSLLSPALPLRLSPSDSVTAEIEFIPPALGFYSDTLWLYSNDYRSPMAVIAEGTGIAPLVKDTLKMDFGFVAMKKTKTDSVYFSNTGTDTLYISSYELLGSTNFEWIDSANAKRNTLAPMDSMLLVFSFTPDTSDYYQAQLRIRHDAGFWITMFNLTGTGLADSSMVDLGTAIAGNSNYRTYTFTNNSMDTLFISGYSWQSVTEINWTDSNTTKVNFLAPGTSVIFSFEFTPDSIEHSEARLDIFHQSSVGQTSIVLRGEGKAPILALAAAVDFEKIRTGKTLSKTIRIYNTGNATCTINSLPLQVSEFSLSQNLPVSIAEKDSLELEIFFTPTDTISYSDTLHIISDALNKPVYVLLQGKGIAPVLKVDTLLDFGKVKYLGNKQASILLTNTGSDTLRIDNFQLTNGTRFSIPGLSLPLFILPDSSFSYTITVSPNGIPFPLHDSLHIHHDAGNSPVLVHLSAEPIFPLLLSSKFELDFGKIKEDSTAQINFTLKNSGTDTALILNHTHTTAGIFQASPVLANYMLVPGDSVVMQMSFTPDSAILYGDTLFISNNNFISPLKIALKGEGEAKASVGVISIQQNSLFTLVPNPASQLLEIRYQLPGNQHADFMLYDNTGRFIRRLTGATAPGLLTCEVGDLAPGKYYVRLVAGTLIETETLLIIR